LETLVIKFQLIFFAVIGALVLVFVVLHLTGHGFESHGH